jgi:hypothetical protein
MISSFNAAWPCWSSSTVAWDMLLILSYVGKSASGVETEGGIRFCLWDANDAWMRCLFMNEWVRRFPQVFRHGFRVLDHRDEAWSW